MSKLVNVFRKDLPNYLDLIEEKSVETPEEIKTRLIDKINKYNGGSDEYI